MIQFLSITYLGQGHSRPDSMDDSVKYVSRCTTWPYELETAQNIRGHSANSWEKIGSFAQEAGKEKADKLESAV